MANILSYGGVPLPLQTTEMIGYLNSRFKLEDTIQNFGVRPWPGNWLSGIAFPWQQYSPRKISLSELFYPTGACRWCEYHCVISQDQYNPIAAACFTNPGPTPQDFIMGTDQGGITTPLYALPPRKLQYGNSDGSSIWLLSLVCERYYWQNSKVSLFTSDWATAFDDVAFALNISSLLTVDPISADYLIPSPLSDLVSPASNAAVILDALCYNCGLRLVRNSDGTYRAISNSNADILQTTNLTNTDGVLAGGEMFS